MENWFAEAENTKHVMHNKDVQDKTFTHEQYSAREVSFISDVWRRVHLKNEWNCEKTLHFE